MRASVSRIWERPDVRGHTLESIQFFKVSGLLTARACHAMFEWFSHHERVFMIYLSAVYFIGAISAATSRPLWYDELYTLHVSQLDSLEDVWRALMVGIDVTPPLFNLVTRWSLQLFGASELGVRMPAIIGFWVFLVSLYHFATRSGASALHASLAMLIPMSAASRLYSTEARPYALVLAFSGLALLLWRPEAIRSGWRRWIELIGLAACLAGTVSVHYYGVAIAVPLIIGELIRSVKRRYADWGKLAVLLIVPAGTLAAHIPFMPAALSYEGGAWSEASVRTLVESYSGLFGVSAALILALAVVLLVGMALLGTHSSPAAGKWQLPPGQLAAVGSFLAVPVVVFLIARLSNGIFTARYAIPAIIAGALLIPWAIAQSKSRVYAVAPLMVLCLSAWVSGLSIRAVTQLTVGRQVPHLRLLDQLASGTSEPIVIPDPQVFMQVRHYSPALLAQRLHFIAEPALARRFGTPEDDERSLELLQQAKPIGVTGLESFVARYDRFLIYLQGNEGKWLLPLLKERGATVVAMKLGGSRGLYLVPSAKALRYSSSHVEEEEATNARVPSPFCALFVPLFASVAHQACAAPGLR